MFKNKVILITGGTGSFGQVLVKKLINSSVKEIRILSRDEKKQEDMRNSYNNKKLKFFIGDVKDTKSIISSVQGSNYIFHAAALKQVPSCEFYPIEAVKTNVYGTENVIDAAVRENVEKVVLLSTDKAVYPINAMGMSKALAEKCLISKSRNIKKGKTILCATRYGNVMASRGSVIPLLINQIQNKKHLTITDPKMTRFMMSLNEAIDLVFFAFKNAKQGDIFVQKSPACTLDTLVSSLKQIFKSNSKVKIIGTRHGEKLYETLVSREEMSRAKEIKNYFCIPVDDRDLNFNIFFNKGVKDVSFKEDYTSHNTKRLNIKSTIKLLNDIKIKDMIND